MKINVIKPIVASILFAGSFLLITFRVVSAAPDVQTQPATREIQYTSGAASYSTSPLLQGPIGTTATVQAQSGETISYTNHNGDTKHYTDTHESLLPYLVLHHEDGRLAPEISRTLGVGAASAN
jgi:hypothetical protein